MSYGTPPPPPQEPGYGQPAGYGATPQKNSAMAVTGLVLGIIGAIPCFWGCLIFSIGAIIFSKLGSKDIREANGAKKGAGAAKWGFILGIAGLVLGVIYWILVGTGVIDITYSGKMS